MSTYEYWHHPDWQAAQKARTTAYMALIESTHHIERLKVEHDTYSREHPAIVAYQHGPQQKLRDNLGAAQDHLRATEERLKAEQPALEAT